MITTDIKERFLSYIEENSLINKGDGIVVGLSGGEQNSRAHRYHL